MCREKKDFRGWVTSDSISCNMWAIKDCVWHTRSPRSWVKAPENKFWSELYPRPERRPHTPNLFSCSICSGSLTRQLSQQECQYIKLAVQRVESYVNLFHSTASKTFVCDCSSLRDMTVLLFTFVFLLHLSFFYLFWQLAPRMCFPSHRWGGRLNLKAVSVTWRSHSHSLSAARSLMRTNVVVVFCTL